MHPYVFLDRDGTLVEDPNGYIHRVEDYVLRPRTADGLARLQRAGFGLVILTNQSGIGRGYYTRDDFDRFQAHLTQDLARFGVRIDATFLCPHRPDAGCNCRKPRTGLLEQARSSLAVDFERSWMIGDSSADVGLARSAGLRCIRIQAPHEPADPDATHRASDLHECADLILLGTKSLGDTERDTRSR